MAIPDEPGLPKDTAESEGTAAGSVNDYKVGYGKPPLHSRFRPGHGGNPRGRPKHSRNLKTIVAEELKTGIAITENGKRRTVSALQALIKKLLQLGLQGNHKASHELLELVQKFMESDETAAIQPFDAERDREIIAAYLRQMKDDDNG